MTTAPSPALNMSPPTAPPAAPALADRNTRIGAAILGFIALVTLIIAAILPPSPTGMGTHRALGLPECGWLLSSGYPCPTCGMTTSFSAAAHAQPLHALKAQPFGAAFALATAVFFWGAMHVALFGSNLGRAFERLLRARYLIPTAVLFIAAWAYKCWIVRTGS